MNPEKSLIGRALTFRDTLVANGKLDGSKPTSDKHRRARGTGWQARVTEGRNMLKKPPGK